MNFPKIIHQIWYQGINKASNKLKENSMLVKLYHSFWIYIIWDNIMITKFIKNDTILFHTYKNFKYLHQKVDFFKYIILYKLGGVYIDMDVRLLKSFDNLIKENNNYDVIVSSLHYNKLENFVLCHNSICINNGIIISKPGSDFLFKIINQIISFPNCYPFDINSSLCINNTTGPSLFTQVYINYPFKNKIKVLDWSYLEPCVSGNLCEIKDNTVAIHEHNNSWINENIIIIAYYYFKYKSFIYLLILISLILIIKKLNDKKLLFHKQ